MVFGCFHCQFFLKKNLLVTNKLNHYENFQLKKLQTSSLPNVATISFYEQKLEGNSLIHWEFVFCY
jgi:hypothetical protein